MDCLLISLAHPSAKCVFIICFVCPANLASGYAKRYFYNPLVAACYLFRNNCDCWFVCRHWAAVATAKYPELAVTRCHSYEIQFKHMYRCQNIDCGMEIGRHSKSVDVSRQVC